MMQLDWNAAIETIRETLPQTQFYNWFRPLRLIRYDSHAVVLGVPSKFHGEWVKNNYGRHLKSALQKQTGSDLQLEFEILVRDENIEASLSSSVDSILPVPPAVTVARPQLRVVEGSRSIATASKPEVASAPERENHSSSLPFFPQPYAVMQFNKLPYECTELLLEDLSHLQVVILQGGIGLGKTHLMADFAQRYQKRFPNKRVRYTHAEAFTQEMVQALKTDTIFSFKQKYREETDLLLFDDIQLLSRRTRSQEELLYIYNEILNRGGKVIFSSREAIQDLADFSESLKSRLFSSVVVEFRPLSTEDSFKLVCHLASFHKIAQDLLLFKQIAEKQHRDVREVSGTLLRLHLQSRLQGKQMNSEMVERQAFLVDSAPKKVDLDVIIDLVVQQFSVPKAELVSKSRKNVVTWARQVAMYLARLYTLLPLQEIGKYFGRDHATVIHAFQKVSESLQTQSSKRYQVEYLKSKLDPSSRKSQF